MPLTYRLAAALSSVKVLQRSAAVASMPVKAETYEINLNRHLRSAHLTFIAFYSII